MLYYITLREILLNLLFIFIILGFLYTTFFKNKK